MTRPRSKPEPRSELDWIASCIDSAAVVTARLLAHPGLHHAASAVTPLGFTRMHVSGRVSPSRAIAIAFRRGALSS